jgi:hypothetical protein
VQYKIKQAQLDRLNKSKAVTPITLSNKDDKALMQQMSYDTSTGPS